MSTRCARRRRHGGFTMLELIVVISILVALSAILIPAVSNVMEDSKVTEVATLCDTLKKACTQHHNDTNQFAIEYSGAAYVAASYHGLSMTQSYLGWRGPYMESALSTKANPWNGSIHMYNQLLVNGMTGWDLDRDGTAETTVQAGANVLYLTGLPESAAKNFDLEWDQGDLAANVDWKTAGRAVFSTANNGTLWVLVHRKD